MNQPTDGHEGLREVTLPIANSNQYLHVLAMANMLILFYLFCSGKTEDNLTHIFNLFDQDGNKVSMLIINAVLHGTIYLLLLPFHRKLFTALET